VFNVTVFCKQWFLLFSLRCLLSEDGSTVFYQITALLFELKEIDLLLRITA
jgi:hypothetical protein